MKKKSFSWYLLILALCIGVLTTFSGCGSGPLNAPKDFTIDSNGAFSFKGVSGANMYRIDVYLTKYISNGTISKDAQIACTANVAQSKGTVKGTASSVKALPYGNYTAVISSVPKSGSKRTKSEAVFSSAFTRSGSLSVPAISVTKNNWGATIKLTDDACKNYLEKEGAYSFKYQVFSDEACTKMVTEGTFGKDITHNPNAVAGPNAINYNNASVDFAVAEGQAASYWVKCMAVGNTELKVTDSEWSKAVKVDIDGKKPENNSPFGPPAGQ
ncbi:hypothetical protein [Clostridium folliculivorans]|uniref:Lipoprotein n=1 Tax=Clostridium folliculivorans TaxID=2886038 RepID=A0A9W5Y0C5_9CLOT|nr:hypothetical protein [Clostridium folliculivorans]GKU24199.1 hypothetical protein CFOLD11_10250 [Clostridium folliculivorans]GKU30304.1 hypothetical protein CFB3_24110 [Clostridium folliculivorans]